MKRFWKMLIANAHLKVLALGFAVLIYAILNQGYEITDTLPHVPVRFVVPDTLCPPAGNYDVTLTLNGSRKAISKLKAGSVEGVIRLAPDLKTSRHEIALNAADFNLPDVEIVKISPAYLEIPIQRKITRTLPVEPLISGRPMEGYRLGEVSVVPDRVEVTGAESSVGELKKIQSAVVSVKGENSDFSKESVELRLPGKELTSKPRTVSVNVQIRKRLNRNRVFTNVPVRYLFPQEYSSKKSRVVFSASKPQTVDLEVVGPDRDVQHLSADDLFPFVNLTAAEKPGKIIRRVECLPVPDFPEVKVMRIFPPEIEINSTKNESFLWNR